MNTDVLHRLREGVASKRFTLTKLAELSGVPLATLSDMSHEHWRPQILERFEKLRAALDQIDRNTASQEKSEAA